MVKTPLPTFARGYFWRRMVDHRSGHNHAGDGQSFSSDADNGTTTTCRIICHADRGNNLAVSSVDRLGTPSSGHSQIAHR